MVEDRVMHGYGVACFTAKCRRRAAAPAPLAFYILDVPSLNPPFPPTVALSSPMLLRHPRRGFLSSVSLCLPFPRRAVASRRVVVRCLTRIHSSRPRACIYRSHTRPSLSLSRIPLAPAMHAALHPPCRAHLGCRSLATTESVGLQRVFSTSRGKPRSLRLTRADFRAALIALGAECGMRGFPSPRHRVVVILRLFALCRSRRQTSLPPPRAYFARSSRYGEGRVSTGLSWLAP